MSNKLEVSNLRKSYKSHWTFKKKPVLNGLSFAVKEGESFALLGANGAGKTSTMKSILGFTSYDSGEINFEGQPLTNLNQRRKIAFLPEQPYFYQHLSVRETLDFYASLFGYRSGERKMRVADAMERLGLASRHSDRIRNLSKGQQQRVGLAQILLGDPELLILDEPFSGLDPLARVEIRNLLFSLKNDGRTIIIASHILSDIELLCDSAVILVGGICKERVILKELFNDRDVPFRVTVDCRAESHSKIKMIVMNSGIRLDSIDCLDTEILMNCRNHEDAQLILKLMLENDLSIRELIRAQSTLEELFVKANRKSDQ